MVVPQTVSLHIRNYGFRIYGFRIDDHHNYNFLSHYPFLPTPSLLLICLITLALNTKGPTVDSGSVFQTLFRLPGHCGLSLLCRHRSGTLFRTSPFTFLRRSDVRLRPFRSRAYGRGKSLLGNRNRRYHDWTIGSFGTPEVVVSFDRDVKTSGSKRRTGRYVGVCRTSDDELKR